MTDKKEFDVNQGHGDHNDCICEPGVTKEFFSTWIPKCISEGELIALTEEKVLYNSGDGKAEKKSIAYLGDKKGPMRLELLLALDEDQNTLESAYPEYDGAEVKVKVTKIHEWANGIEATLEGTVLGEAERDIAFFDTRYALHKGDYEIGKEYTFSLAAFAYNAEVVPEKEREFRLEGDNAIKHRERLGDEPEYEEDGSPKPVVFRMDEMVAFFSKWGPYPDDAEFQSPAFEGVEEFNAFDTTFLKFSIAIAREEEDVIIPMIARKSMFKEIPKTKDPVRGMLWLQGYRVDCKKGDLVNDN